MENIVLYLSGPIDKVSGEVNVFYQEVGAKLISLGATVLTPEIRPDDVSDPQAVYLRDIAQSALADTVVVDARESCGLGVGAEVLSALCSGGSAIFISPPQTHYRRSSVTILGRTAKDWTHPFVFGMSNGHLIEATSIDDVVKEIVEKHTARPQTGHVSPYIARIISEFNERCLPNDPPMQAAFQSNPVLSQRYNNILKQAAS